MDSASGIENPASMNPSGQRPLRVVLTGASRGIGRALALQLARTKAQVLLNARGAEALEQVARQVEAAGSRALVVAGDLTRHATREAIYRRVEQHWGALDVLINNAGVGAMGPFLEASPERLRQVMELNLFAAAEMIRLGVPRLALGRDPAVVNIGSILSYVPLPMMPEYTASKFALRGLSEALRPELAERGIHLLLVHPATTDTEFFDSVLEQSRDTPWRSRRPVSPEAVARRTLRALKKRKQELFPDASSWSLYRVARWLPGAVRWMLCRRY